MKNWNREKLRRMARRRAELYSTVRYLTDRREAARESLGRARQAERYAVEAASPVGPSQQTIGQRERAEREIAALNSQLSDASSRWQEFATVCDRCTEYARQHLGWRE